MTATAAPPSQTTRPPAGARLVRPCVLCGADDAELVFRFTWEVLVGVYGWKPEELGWTPGDTSSLVRCRACKTHYLRDIVLPPAGAGEDHGDETGDPRIGGLQRRFPVIDAQAWTIRTLVLWVLRRSGQDPKLLDFGAGGGWASNQARALGLGEVVAYDPYIGNGPGFYRRFNFPGIAFTADLQEVERRGPYDVVICNSVLEHMTDPREELETLFRLMRPGGLMAVNNPLAGFHRDLPRLQGAQRISKGDTISGFHPLHYNYLAPRQFERLLRQAGFRITALATYPPAPLVRGLRGYALKQQARHALRTLQNLARIPYDRYAYVVERP